MKRIDDIKIRRILNSTGKIAYEAQVELECGAIGIASAPSAILPGIREKNITAYTIPKLLIEKMKFCCFSQETLDNCLANYIDELGSDITLAISLAFARAYSCSLHISLVQYLRKLIGLNTSNRHIAPLIPIFSGGIHDYSLGGSIQQIMLKVSDLDFGTAVHVILTIFEEVERFLEEKNLLKGLSASSGFLINGMNVEEEFAFLTDIIQKSVWRDNLSIAIDVAAEHLWKNGNYMFYNQLYTPDEFENLLYKYITKFPISYVEDPFDFRNEKNWKSLYGEIEKDIQIFSDDYSATQIQYLDDSIVDGVIIKMKQVGTLTATLKLVSKIKSIGLKSCVSHRSCETEDTFICDLAVAIDSDYMKIGGPRRGDRIEKYNQLIRLYDIYL